eukprot:m.151804 g.151804  ORF g.151804 m.151804 type:complete len:96 (+) comp14307_c0_seq3:233-520(+)
MQKLCQPIVPFRVVARMVAKAHGGRAMRWRCTPAAVRAIDELMEHALRRLVEEALLVALHRGSAVVTPVDLELAGKINPAARRREQANSERFCVV